MKLLFDQNISFRTVNQLRELFPDARHVKDFDHQFASDKQIWELAKAQGYSIVTFDSDFLDLVTLFGHPPKISWLRLGNTSSSHLSQTLTDHFASIKSFLKDEQYKEIACLEISR